MKRSEVLELARVGEGITLEFKESIGSNIGKEMCAFANAKGGKILLGIADNGKIKGISTTNQLKSQIQSYARNVDPALSVEVEPVGDALVIHIPEGTKKPYSVNGQFFLRIGANSQQLNRDEVRDFFQQENLVLFDNQPNTDFDFKTDFDKQGFERFLGRAKITDTLKAKDILRNLFLLDGAHLKNAGVLFFCKNVKKFFVWASITCVLYQGKTKTNILDRKEFDADILSNYNNALTYLISKLNTRYIIRRERSERLELPEEALREAVINAVVHRDYFSTGHVQIDIFLDRVEIRNPGGLVKGLSLKDFGKVSLPRNPLIMDLMLRMSKVEKVGSGIRRIKDAMKEYGLKVSFESTGFFTVVFQRETRGLTAETAERSTRKIPEKYQKIIEAIKENPSISRKELSAALGETEETIQSRLRKLVKDGLVGRVGPAKGGCWKVLK